MCPTYPYGWTNAADNLMILCEKYEDMVGRAVCCEPVSAEFPAETSIGSPMDVGAL